eukprot:Skav215923  [mRNA]  locus=scaffold226:237795:239258:+ [translate_table: standard]
MRPPSRNETEAKILTSRIKQAESATKLFAVLEEAVDSKVFNDFHASAAYHSLATLSKRGKLKGNMGKNPVLSKLNDRTEAILADGQARARALANVVWSLQELSKPLPNSLDIVPPLVLQMQAEAQNMNPQEVSNSLWAVASLMEAAPELQKTVPALVCQVGAVAKDMEPQSVSNSLWAAVLLKDSAPEVLQTVPALVSRVPTVAREMNSQGLSNSLWAAAKLKEAAPDVLKMVGQLIFQTEVVVKDMTPRDVSNCLWAAATLMDVDAETSDIFLVLAPQVLATAEHMNAQDVSNSLWAIAIYNQSWHCGRVEDSVPALFAQVSKLLSSSTCLSPQHLSMTLESLVLLQDCECLEGDSVRDFAERAVHHLGFLLDHPHVIQKADLLLSVPTVVWASARLGVYNYDFVESVSLLFPSVKDCFKLSDWSVCAMLESYKTWDKKEHKDFQKMLRTVVHKKGLLSDDVRENIQFGPRDFYRFIENRASPRLN